MESTNYLEEFRHGNYRAFDAFYEKTRRAVYFTALGILKDASLAETVTQDTYIAFLQNVDSARDFPAVQAYLIRIARNKSINCYHAQKKVLLGEEHFETVGVEDTPDDGTVEAILGLLPRQDEREIVVYHVLLGYKFREIAHFMNIPLGTVLWKYQKAMKQLRKEVSTLL